MNIGVDIRALNNLMTGIGRYKFELLNKLTKFSDLNFHLYSPAPIAPDLKMKLGGGFFRSGVTHNRISKMAWAQSQLPYWAKKDGVDLFWGPTHRIPRLLPKSIARVVTIHDLVWKFAPQTMRPLSFFMEKRLASEAIALADLVMVDSQSTAQGIAEVFPHLAHKVRIVYLGVSKLPNPDRSALKKFNIAKPYFLFSGTIEPRKNLERLLRAFSMLPSSLKEKYSLIIAGGIGWGGVNLEKIITEHQLNDSVKLLGYVTDNELAVLYSNARFLAMPSIYEGFGLPLLEAMQYGTPVLTSHESSMAEVVGSAGLLIDPFSVESISFGIQQMLGDDELIKVLGIKSLFRSQDFSWDKCAVQTLAVFREAMALRNIRISNS